MPIVDYWLRTTKLVFHDLTSYLTPPRNLRTLLGQGMKFIPTPYKTTSFSDLNKDRMGLHHLERSLRLACFFLAHPLPDTNYNPKLWIPSDWQPHENYFPTIISRRMQQFAIKIKQLFATHRALSNLSLPHRHALTYLRKQTDFLVVHCDKNLGPALIERDAYIRFAFRDHLNDSDTYQILTKDEAIVAQTLNVEIYMDWVKKYDDFLLDDEKKYLNTYPRTVLDPFPYFYLLMKIHKSPLKTRPIISYSGSYFYGLGVWIDQYLQKVAVTLRSYLKSSLILRTEIDTLSLAPNHRHRLFTADATSMYTNINTRAAVNSIFRYIESKPSLFPDIPLHALGSAIEIIMTRNIFQFGDTFWQQKNGTAMGAPPAPSYATVSFGTHEEAFLDEFPEQLSFYRRYIDDVFGIWTSHDDPDTDLILWNQFCSRLNGWHNLEWIVSDRSAKVDFLDLTISLNATLLSCSLFEKSQNLHLYLPPRSAHPPGVIYGVVSGIVYRARSLCTDPMEANRVILRTWRHLITRGYTQSMLRPIFQKALRNTILSDAKTIRPTNPDDSLWLFKIQYHPQDPPSSAIQKAWDDAIANPPLSKPLHNIDVNFKCIGKRRFVVCYKRPPNLSNLLSYRKIKHNTGPPVSSFYHG